MTRIGIGIDTGGTYTDAVVYDFETKEVLAKAKALTTKQDLSIGIVEALDSLPLERLPAPSVISLSTTLATNACVENKIGRARLVFFGGDAGVIDRSGGEFGLPQSDEMVIQESMTNYSDGVIGEVDWDALLEAVAEKIEGLDGLGVIEIYSMRNGAVVEKKAKSLLEERFKLPVVCGHELVSELNCLQRGASTLVNASLFPIINSFIAAIKAALKKRGIAAPLVIVRSDGNLMGEEFATLRPAETLLCGPAASVMGAMELAGTQDCVIVDMGGTTTDIALIRESQALLAENGITIARWKTFIKGLYIKTFGLGGDSAIHYADQKLVLEEYRVTPLCIAAAAYPEICGQLLALKKEFPKHTRFLHEGFMLVKDIGADPRYSDFEKQFCRALENGPLLLKNACAQVGKDEYNLNVSRLVADGVVQMFGLTPTDIMHLKGDFTRFSTEASQLGAEFVAANVETSVAKLCDMAYDEVRKKLFLNIVYALLEKESLSSVSVEDKVLTGLALQYYERVRHGKGRGFIHIDFKTALKLVGIGAPIHVFLPEVAAMLGTEAIIPRHAEVANALGAVVGKIHAKTEIDIRPIYTPAGISGYTVYGLGEPVQFEELNEAEVYAVAEARRGARDEALRRGATGEVAVSHRLYSQDIESRKGAIYLGSKAVAYAVGSMSF